MTSSSIRKKAPARADTTPPVQESAQAGKGAAPGKPGAAPAVSVSIGADDLERVVKESQAALADAPKKTGRPLGRRDSQPRKRPGDPDGPKTETQAPTDGATPGEIAVDAQAVAFVATGVRKAGDVLAVRRGCDAWKRSEAQSLEIAQPAAYLMAYFFPQMDPKTAAALSLLMAVGGWVGEGLEAERKMKPKPATVANPPVVNGHAVPVGPQAVL